MSEQKPSVGRIVHFHTKNPGWQANGAGEGPYAAVIVQVWSDICVNLKVLPSLAAPFDATSITNDPNDQSFWAWPPRV